jgi:hypothetical protein
MMGRWHLHPAGVELRECLLLTAAMYITSWTTAATTCPLTDNNGLKLASECIAHTAATTSVMHTTPACSLPVSLRYAYISRTCGTWGHQFRCDRPNNWRMYRNLQVIHSQMHQHA